MKPRHDDPTLWGGPAFPWALPDKDKGYMRYFFGMSLRDWFAGQALPVVLRLRADETKDYSAENVAVISYAHADAMLAEREKSQPKE